jgi:hypothetical protein
MEIWVFGKSDVEQGNQRQEGNKSQTQMSVGALLELEGDCGWEY